MRTLDDNLFFIQRRVFPGYTNHYASMLVLHTVYQRFVDLLLHSDAIVMLFPEQLTSQEVETAFVQRGLLPKEFFLIFRNFDCRRRMAQIALEVHNNTPCGRPHLRPATLAAGESSTS